MRARTLRRKRHLDKEAYTSVREAAKKSSLRERAPKKNIWKSDVLNVIGIFIASEAYELSSNGLCYH